MASELPKQYEPSTIEQHISDRWLAAKAFAAFPDDRLQRYVIMMPLPNVTGALHMGHAMDNVMQDLLIRWHRMMGDNTLWMPGTDHAGIATQAVIEKRLLELEGKTRHDVGREGLVQRIWEWKDQYQKRIVSQQQAMGCSCDWDRQRFTMDDICARGALDVLPHVPGRFDFPRQSPGQLGLPAANCSVRRRDRVRNSPGPFLLSALPGH